MTTIDTTCICTYACNVRFSQSFWSLGVHLIIESWCEGSDPQDLHGTASIWSGICLYTSRMDLYSNFKRIGRGAIVTFSGNIEGSATTTTTTTTTTNAA